MLRQTSPASADGRRNGGFALIIVLWTLVLIGFIVAHLSASGRTEVRIASNLVANSAAQAAADGAIYEAIFNLSDPTPEQRWPIDGMPRQVAVGGSRITIRLEDEASWINPSTASPALLEALLRVTGSDPDNARSLATAIGEWVGSAAAARPQDALIADYRAAGLDYGPPSAPLETLGELGRVLGMTPSVLAAIRPHLTLFGPPEPNPASTDPVVAAALALSSAGLPTIPQASQPPPDTLTVRISSLAAGPGNARVNRTAVVRLGTGQSQGYAVLAWSSSLDLDVTSAVAQPTVTR
ncbi:MAG: general secretion pathway protein GspK [Alphaproteobacteria bacterium]|nr:general secretion pathway protein GspK [Alphaproteobacteria bacterium]